jgi:streptothricin acetyltransferase
VDTPSYELPSSVFELREQEISSLHRYAAVRSRFEARTVFDVSPVTDGFTLRERELPHPYQKDYDAIENPMEWPERFDISNWTVIGAFSGDEQIGGVVGALTGPGLEMLKGREDLIALWDIRVASCARRMGVGTALFRAVESWALERNCRELVVETQNTNVAACRFYERQGCRLKGANFHAYPFLPNEIQFIWAKTLCA